MELQNNTMEEQDSSVVAKIEQRIKIFEESQGTNAANGNLYDVRYKQFIVDISKIVADQYENLVENLRNRHLRMFQNRISENSYKSTGKLDKYIEKLTAKRKEMIKIVNSCADSLDNSYHMANIGRVLSSLVDLVHNLDAITEHKMSNFVTEEAFGIHPILGFVSQALCRCVPHFANLGLLSTFVDVLNSKVIMRDALKIIKEDVESFEDIVKWFQETNKIDEQLNKLFNFGIDVEIVTDIEQILAEYDSYTKVFCTVFFSNVRKNPSLMKDEIFLCKAVLFSRNDIAMEWYNRALKMKHPIEFEAEKLEYRSSLMRLSRYAVDSNTTLELGNQVIKLKNAPHLVQATINCVAIYFSFQELMIGTKHKNSELLRELSKRARFCLEELENIKRQLESV